MQSLNAALDLLECGAIITDAQGEIKWTSQRAMDKLNLWSSSQVNNVLTDLDWPDSKPIKKALRNKKTVCQGTSLSNLTIHDQSGQGHLLSVSIGPLQANHCKDLLWIIKEPGEASKLKAALEAKETYLQDIAESLPGVVFQFYARANGEYGLYYLSGRAEEIFDFPPQHNDPFSFCVEHLDKRDLEPFFRSIAQATKNVAPWEFEGRYNKPSGDTLWVKGLSRPVSANSSEVVFNGLLLDVSAQKQVELALLSSEHRFRAIFDIGPQGILILRKKDWTVLKVNQAFFKFVDYPEEKIVGKNFFHLNCFCEKNKLKTLKDELLAHGRLEGKRFKLKDRNGSEKVVLFSSALLDLDGEESVITSFIDITEQDKLEQQLLQMKKMEALGQLAGELAHDFKNMLAGIMGAAELLLIQEGKNTFQKKYLDQIIEITEQATSLTQQLLDISHHQPAPEVCFDLSACLEKSIAILSHCLGPQIEIKTKFSDSPLAIIGDPSQIQNAILNLGLNAKDAMPNGGYIEISSQICTTDELGPLLALEKGLQSALVQENNPRKFVRITVTDQGEGIPPQFHSKIFEPFFTTKPKGKGTGLGLASVYATVKRHQGWINFQSQPGQGTSFMIYLPLAQKTLKQKAALFNQNQQANYPHANLAPKRLADTPS